MGHRQLSSDGNSQAGVGADRRESPSLLWDVCRSRMTLRAAGSHLQAERATGATWDPKLQPGLGFISFVSSATRMLSDIFPFEIFFISFLAGVP